ncbi:MAG TPA: trigger factor, partial [Candidatus Saccharimonadaceae bacterium]|nr:trigger factor [Candidatus Saccharimonadaceae bacterium]
KKEVTRTAKDGDEAVIDFVGTKDGVAFEGGTAKDYALTLGSNLFIPGFETAIVGHKPGEKPFDIPLEFPGDYHAADLAGQKVVFTVTLKKLSEVVKPAFDDVFAAKAGPFTSMKELTDDVKRELTAQREKEADAKLKDALVDALIAKSETPVPDVLVDDQMTSIEQDMTQNLMYQGLSLEQYLKAQKFSDKADWVAREARPAAVKRVQAGLVLAELSKILKIEATSDELAEHLNQYRDQYKNNPEMVKRFDEPEVQRDVANRLITEMTVDRLVELNSKK